MLNSRPKLGENEDDLLEFQAQFLSSGEKPSAKVVRSSKSKSSQQGISNRTTGKPQHEKSSHYPASDIGQAKPSKFRESSLLSLDIKERNVAYKPITFPTASKLLPPYSVQNESLKTLKSKKGYKAGTSLFAQRFKRDEKSCHVSVSDAHTPSLDKNPPKKSNILSEKERLDIDRENNLKLQGMSSADILNEQRKLKASLDPSLFEFLTSRKKKFAENTFQNYTTEDPSKEVCEILAKDTNDAINPGIEIALKSSVLEQNKDWMNMDKPEQDKMKWMKQLPVGKKSKEVILPNRFDFEGCLLTSAESEAMPSYIGLHHHGEEPELGGYTLQELIEFSRSDVLQQRVFALKVLAKIIVKDKCGHYSQATLQPNGLIPILLEAGIVFIMRWALDESSTNCLHAAVHGLWCLIKPHTFQQQFLTQCFLSYRGCETPTFQPATSTQTKDKSTQSDLEIAQSDVILGLLRMDILQRLRYVVEVCQPDVQVVIKCCEIFTQICQHSVGSAIRVMECPRLVSYIIQTFLCLPLASPFPHAVKLLRYICQSGRHAASRLLTDHKDKLLPFMMNFLAQIGGMTETSYKETELEVWKLWIVCLSYGHLVDACQDILPTILLQLQACIKHVQERMQWIQHVIKFITALASNLSQANKDNSAFSAQLQWTEMKAFYPLMITLVQNAVNMTLNIEKPTHEAYCIVTLGIDFLTLYYSKASMFVQAVDLIEEVETNIIPSIITPLENLISKILVSNCKVPEMALSQHVTPLPDLSLGQMSLEKQSQLQLSLYYDNLLSSYLRLCVAVCKIHLPSSKCLVSLLQRFGRHAVSSKLTLTKWNSFITKPRHRALYWLVKLFSLAVTGNDDLKCHIAHFHHLSLRCFTSLTTGDESYAFDLLSNVIFNLNFMEDIRYHHQGLPETFLEDLARVRSTYMGVITFSPKQLIPSTNRSSLKSHEISTFFLPAGADIMIPADWPYLRIVYLYDLSLHDETDTPKQTLSNCNTVLLCLKFLTVLEQCRSSYWNDVNVTAKLLRLMCIYLIDSETFLNDAVRNAMHGLFKMHCTNEMAPQIDFGQPVPGITSFYDFYVSLLDQYEAVSYGDSLFSAVIMLPLVQRCEPKLKLALWSQHTAAIRTITLNETDILLPIESYLQPPENNYNVICAYVTALASGVCQKDRSPFLYRLTIHHISTYLSGEVGNQKSRPDIHLVIKDVAVREDILKYVSPF
ncbi:unnamed protein product [Clavelina lepadiformis]|uniref:RNA polymerase II-associated protein 1 n=1 Tax=Clavelina lepadiformis TaxID=159417 RepID=A0ABP0GUW4_CLALP